MKSDLANAGLKIILISTNIRRNKIREINAEYKQI